MARNDYVERPGEDAPSADGLADDLKLLLDQLATQITDADQRHSETVHGMQERAAALTERAAAAKPTVPEDYSEAYGRVENAMAALADQLAHVEPVQRHEEPAEPVNAERMGSDPIGHELSAEVRAGVRRAILGIPQEPESAPPALRSALTGPAAPARPEPSRSALDRGWDNPTARASSPPIRSRFGATEEPTTQNAAQSAEPAWLEARLADIAGRVEQSVARLDPHNSLLALGERFGQLERRFDAALEHLAKPASGDGIDLHALEKQITDLFGELGHAQKQLGRLDTIESRLSELRQSPTEQQMTQLISALSPSDKQLSVVAEAAAERVAERMRVAIPQAAAGDVDGTSLGSLTALIQEFMSDRRQGDAQTAEALDTMQLAMQHLIDRVEAIELAQSSGHEELLRAAQATPARRPERPLEPMDFGVRESNLTPAAMTSGPEEMPQLAVASPIISTDDDDEAPEIRSPAPREPRFDHERPAPMPELAADPAIAAPQVGTDRQAFIAMARRAAEKASRDVPPAQAATATGAKTDAKGWMQRLSGSVGRGDRSASARQPRILLIASLVAFLLAGFWMVTATGLRGYIAGSVSELLPAKQDQQPTNEDAPASARSAADTQPGADEQAAARVAPASYQPGGASSPAAARVSDGIGIVIDNGHRTNTPAAMERAAEQARVAGLSAKLSQDRPPFAATASALPGQAAQYSGVPSAGMSRSVEMPPAMLGPLSLRHAAANGDPAAQLEIAARYAEGKGVGQDFAQAAIWYQRAASHGLATAQYRLGALYDRGLGVQADPARARIWYGRAAEQGNLRAMHNLAVLSAGRANGSPDYPGAVQWFSEAANRGLADSQYNLGILYESGLGVPASLADAYKWYSLAARSGDKDAIRRRDAARLRLDKGTLNAVDRVIIDWRAKPTEAAANDTRNAGQIWRAQSSTQTIR